MFLALSQRISKSASQSTSPKNILRAIALIAMRSAEKMFFDLSDVILLQRTQSGTEKCSWRYRGQSSSGNQKNVPGAKRPTQTSGSSKNLLGAISHAPGHGREYRAADR
jgi:hypothetical protein